LLYLQLTSPSNFGLDYRKEACVLSSPGTPLVGPGVDYLQKNCELFSCINSNDKLNIFMDMIVKIQATKLLTENFSRSVGDLRYFLS